MMIKRKIGAASGAWVVILFGWFTAAALPGEAAESAARQRQPVALELSADEQYLYAANRRSGSITVIDAATRRVVGETAVGRGLSALATLPGGGLLATDELGHELLVISAAGQELSVRQRLPVPPYPVSVAVTRDGSRCTVASLWSRRLAFVQLAAEPPAAGGQDPPPAAAEVVAVLDMPFAPRCQLLVNDDAQLIVADSFAGRLAVIDARRRELEHVREFPGHNIRGLGVSNSGAMLIIAHQMLNELAHTVRNDVHWGLLMSNDLRWLRLDAVLDAQADLYTGAHMHPLGHAGSATGDPSGLLVAADGSVIVSLGGVGEIAVGREDDFSLQRLAVGRRPTGLAATQDGGRVFVANTFDDSISVVDVPGREKLDDIALGPPRELTLADRGEQLFFDARLSHDSWMSCHSCHTDGHSNGMLNDNFSDASFGAPKRVLSLLGRAQTAPFAWNASAADVETQIRTSITNTMQSDRDPRDEDVAALAAYLATLEPPPSIDRLRGTHDERSAQRGGELFASLGCADCHAPPVYTTPEVYDVKLADKLGNARFNPPSLLGVGQRGPYFHDNRAKTLDVVFREFGHQLPRQLADDELADLLSFLRSL